MTTAIVRPAGDAGPNQGSPVPSGPHYLNVREDPNDGDLSYVTLGFAGFVEVYSIDVSEIPDGSVVNSLLVRWAAKKGASPCSAQAGMQIGGAYYLATARPLSPSIMVYEEPTTHPDGMPWTKERIAAAFLVLNLTAIDDEFSVPKPHFSQVVGIAAIVEPPDRRIARPTASAPKASELDLGSLRAVPGTLQPTASPVSLAPGAEPRRKP